MGVGEMVESVAPGKMQAGIDLIDPFRNLFSIFKKIYLQTLSTRVNAVNDQISG